VRNSLDPTTLLLQFNLIRTSTSRLVVLRLALEGAVTAGERRSAVGQARTLPLCSARRHVVLPTTVNLFVLYFDQFTFILVTVIEFGFYLSMVRYRRRFLQTPEPAIMTHQ
jgi:hypothetical protein